MEIVLIHFKVVCRKLLVNVAWLRASSLILSQLKEEELLVCSRTVLPVVKTGHLWRNFNMLDAVLHHFLGSVKSARVIFD